MQQQMFAHSTIAGGGRQKEKFHRGVPQIPLLQFAAKANSGKSEEKNPGQQQRLVVQGVSKGVGLRFLPFPFAARARFPPP
jgi:hypothetical protein